MLVPISATNTCAVVSSTPEIGLPQNDCLLESLTLADPAADVPFDDRDPGLGRERRGWAPNFRAYRPATYVTRAFSSRARKWKQRMEYRPGAIMVAFSVLWILSRDSRFPIPPSDLTP